MINLAIHYRVYVFNDYNNTNAFIEYHSYGGGKMESFACSIAKGPVKEYQLSSDCIDIILNYKKVGSFKDKYSARALLNTLLLNCPKECKRDFEANGAEILRVLE